MKYRKFARPPGYPLMARRWPRALRLPGRRFIRRLGRPQYYYECARPRGYVIVV